MPITLETSTGPMVVDTTEPVPGLHVYEMPVAGAVPRPYRWVLAHHEGRVLATFESSDAATRAAESVAPLADWSRNAMTTANQISFGGHVERLAELLAAHGSQHRPV